MWFFKKNNINRKKEYDLVLKQICFEQRLEYLEYTMSVLVSLLSRRKMKKLILKLEEYNGKGN